ncbi:hypothetical protein [Amycolatopsis jiangsuensis]|uniref:Uncharacterized protein n=1 Tax=Amycolatopsis jiangsuensis TaxID=1181879 RepID=A0A840J6Z8_9PSEU|nr:hypothetical protein [Amycolatopsis jiangsuensis]MBB4689168.1 hypothetical protein [Amycolatopsis jiangsuensis]
MTQEVEHRPDAATANPWRTRLDQGDPTDQNWQEVGDEIRIAAQRAGREQQRPETD